MTDFDQSLSAVAAAVENRLGAILDQPGTPERLTAAMRHAVLAGGKRLRPFLVVASARLFGADDAPGDALSVAAAAECLHCYSLVHDDLPSMDDDDLRRGQPTVHRAFDEATAILAGDALQTLAFELLAAPATHPDPAVRAALVLDLATASGRAGMVGGQMLDLAAEGRFGAGAPALLGEAEIRNLQALKTGALIRASCTLGARLAGADAAGLAAITRYGEILGLAFQLADDLLDATGDAATVGKATAKDAGAGKGTLVGLMGIPRARAELAALVQEAAAVLAPYGTRAHNLEAAAKFVAERRR